MGLGKSYTTLWLPSPCLRVGTMILYFFLILDYTPDENNIKAHV